MSTPSEKALAIKRMFLSCSIHVNDACNVMTNGMVTDCHCDRGKRLDAATLAIDALVAESVAEERAAGEAAMLEMVKLRRAEARAEAMAEAASIHYDQIDYDDDDLPYQVVEQYQAAIKALAAKGKA